MQRIWKVLPLALIAVLAFSAIAAASAFAAKEPRWKVAKSFLATEVKEGKEVVQTQKITATSGLTELLVEELNLNVKCEEDSATGTLTGSKAEAPGGNSGVVVTFKKCKPYELSSGKQITTCTIPEEKITTKSLRSKLVWLAKTGSETGDLLEPEGTEGFTTISFTGEKCPLPLTNKVTGTVIGKVAPVEKEETSGTLTFPSPAITKYFTGESGSRVEHTGVALKFGVHPAIYKGTETVSAEGKAFGVFPG